MCVWAGGGGVDVAFAIFYIKTSFTSKLEVSPKRTTNQFVALSFLRVKGTMCYAGQLWDQDGSGGRGW